MAEQKATNVTWHEGSVTRQEREKLLGQKGVTVWMTGLSASQTQRRLRLGAAVQPQALARVSKVGRVLSGTTSRISRSRSSRRVR